MNIFERGLAKAWRIGASRAVYRRLELPPDFRAVTFCFDDFPETAAHPGAGILEASGARGTFYTSFGLLGGPSPSGDLATREQVAALAEKGHEIGCHTYDHFNCALVSPRRAAKSCDTNRAAAAELGLELINFAYPQGGVRRGFKQRISQIYDTARGGMIGVNRGTIDAHDLKAVPVYEQFPPDDIYRLTDSLLEEAGWLILYTHDVSQRPSPFGISESRFRDLVEYMRKAGLPIRTVRAALMEALSANVRQRVAA